jgi:hypothetical protein
VADLLAAAWVLRPAGVAVRGSAAAVVESSLGAMAALVPRLPPGAIAVAGGGGMEGHRAVLAGFGWRVGSEWPDDRTNAESRARPVIPAPDLLD